MDEASKEKISKNESFETAFLKAELKIEKKRQKWLQKKAKISGAPAVNIKDSEAQDFINNTNISNLAIDDNNITHSLSMEEDFEKEFLKAELKRERKKEKLEKRANTQKLIMLSRPPLSNLASLQEILASNPSNSLTTAIKPICIISTRIVPSF